MEETENAPVCRYCGNELVEIDGRYYCEYCGWKEF